MNIPHLLQSYFLAVATDRFNLKRVHTAHFTIFQDLSSCFALPHTPTPDWESAIIELEQAFKLLGKRPVVQFLDAEMPAIYPPLLPILKKRHWQASYDRQLMHCTPNTLLPPNLPPDVSIVTLSHISPLDDIRDGLTTNELGFEPNAYYDPDEETLRQWRKGLVHSRAFTLQWQGQPVGAGMFNPIREAVTELVGITTLEAFRRRGFAGCLSAHATQTAFAMGATLVVLIVGNNEAGRVYNRIGYELTGKLRTYTL